MKANGNLDPGGDRVGRRAWREGSASRARRSAQRGPAERNCCCAAARSRRRRRRVRDARARGLTLLVELDGARRIDGRRRRHAKARLALEHDGEATTNRRQPAGCRWRCRVLRRRAPGDGGWRGVLAGGGCCLDFVGGLGLAGSSGFSSDEVERRRFVGRRQIDLVRRRSGAGGAVGGGSVGHALSLPRGSCSRALVLRVRRAATRR